MNHLVSNRSKILLFAMVLTLSSCALKPISSEYQFINNTIKEVSLDQLGNGTIMIYNGADALHTIDNTARLNVWIDGQALGQIRQWEFMIIDIKKGSHTFKLQHIDLVNMRSDHQVEVTEDTKIIRIEPTITSNKLTITNALPEKMDKYINSRDRN